jgi:hypothetical protein
MSRIDTLAYTFESEHAKSEENPLKGIKCDICKIKVLYHIPKHFLFPKHFLMATLPSFPIAHFKKATHSVNNMCVRSQLYEPSSAPVVHFTS